MEQSEREEGNVSLPPVAESESFGCHAEKIAKSRSVSSSRWVLHVGAHSYLKQCSCRDGVGHSIFSEKLSCATMGNSYAQWSSLSMRL